MSSVNKITNAPTQNEAIEKINEIIDAVDDIIAGGVVVDNKLSTTSTNPVQNKVITGALNDKADDSDVIKNVGGATSQTIELSSGTGTTPLTLKSKASSSCYMSYNANGTWVGSLGVNSSKRPTFYNGTTYTLAYTSDLLTTNTTYGIGQNNSNILQISAANDSQIQAKSSGYKPICPNKLDTAIKVGITTNVLTLTDTEKNTACTWIGAEENTNKVTSLSSSSTDTQYPSAKCVYDLVGDIETLLQGV